MANPAEKTSPRSRSQGYFYAWRRWAVWGAINLALVMNAREKDGPEASPTAGVIDSQSVKTMGKRRPARLRRRQEDQRPQLLLTDTLGHLVGVVVHAADIQDRRRWVVERTLAWLGRCRRLAKDFEATIESALAWLSIAHTRRSTRKIAAA